ncbi:MAG: UMP kinase [Clostridiales bacterium]|nr:UMP kinase [Clostridiales bacterium]
MTALYKRVLIKISGEALAGEKGTGYDGEIINRVVEQIKRVRELGAEVSIVVGGGNFWRGRQSLDMNRSTADYMGMLATVMNSLCLQEALIAKGVPTIVQTAFSVMPVARPFDRREADAALKEGKVVIFGGGTGSPFFSTDTAASLRACEIEADVILLAKNVDGIYDSDPKTNPNAKRYDCISYMDFIAQGLKAMDTSAVTMCMENNVPIFAFALLEENSIVNALCSKNAKGTWIK